MKYIIYRLDFFNGVRFGHGNLESTDISFHADTLFSGLYQEAIKLKKERQFLEEIEQNRLLFTDGFPYIGNQYFIPKPMIQIQKSTADKKGNSREKKLLKNMKYIPQEFLKSYIKGEFPISEMEAVRKLGKTGVKMSVGIRGNEDPEPYRVGAYYFEEGNGLYIILAFQDDKNKELFEILLGSLSYTGLGGKKSSGLGRFEYRECKIPESLTESLQKKGKINLLLSVALPEEEELDEVLNKANYNLIKRGGFVDSERYAEQQMRKQERFVFAPGACFEKTFTGTIKVDKKRGTHPVFRYEKALFLGVDL